MKAICPLKYGLEGTEHHRNIINDIFSKAAEETFLNLEKEMHIQIQEASKKPDKFRKEILGQVKTTQQNQRNDRNYTHLSITTLQINYHYN